MSILSLLTSIAAVTSHLDPLRSLRSGLRYRGSATSRKLWRNAAPMPKVRRKLAHQDTRQRTFARLFTEEFAQMEKYDAPRHVRRLMARRSARRLMAEARG